MAKTKLIFRMLCFYNQNRSTDNEYAQYVCMYVHFNNIIVTPPIVCFFLTKAQSFWKEISNKLQTKRYPLPSLLTLQISVGFGFLHEFVTVFFLSGVVSPTPNRQPGGSGTPIFVWLLPFDLSGMAATISSLRSRQHSSPGHWARKSPTHY
jgi:hypothetical protein